MKPDPAKTKPHLRIGLAGKETAFSLPLSESGTWRIGRDLKNDILLNSARVSPFHAELISTPGGGWSVRDPARNLEFRLVPGSETTIGDLTLLLPARESSPPPQPAPKASGKIDPQKLRLLLVGLIALALIALFLLPAPSPQPPPSLRESAQLSAGPARESPVPGDAAFLDPEARIETAQNSFSLGEQRLKDWKISVENLSLARAELTKARDLLRDLESPPPLLARVNQRLQETEEIMEEEFRKLKFSAEKAIRFRDLDRAEADLDRILRFINYPPDPRYRYAQDRLRDIGRAH